MTDQQAQAEAQNKAIEIYKLFYEHSDRLNRHDHTKQCALIHVKGLIEAIKKCNEKSRYIKSYESILKAIEELCYRKKTKDNV